MATVSLNFPGPLSTKRRRMRSDGGAVNIHLGTGSATPSTTSTSNGSGNVIATADRHSSSNSPINDNEYNNNDDTENISEQKTTQTSKCKGATTIPIFLKKTYKMVDTCDPTIASWTEDGDMFVVKDPDLFAANVIPQYFDHNKFSSFARQLNFYGFRKMQSKPIRNSDFDVSTSKYVTFFNENFKRGRCELLKKIQRSTRGGGTTTPMDQTREIALLRDQVSNLEQQITEVVDQTEERIRRLELEMLSRLEQTIMTLQQQQQVQQQQAVPMQPSMSIPSQQPFLQMEKNTSMGSVISGSGLSHQSSGGMHHLQQPTTMSQQQQQQQQVTYSNMVAAQQLQLQQQQQQNNNGIISNITNNNNTNNNNWDTNSYNNLRGSSISSNANSVANIVGNIGNQLNFLNLQQQQQQQMAAPPTLPPHPKQKQLPVGMMSMNGSGGGNSNGVGSGIPGISLNAMQPPDRMNSLRGLSTLSRGISGLTRGASVESSASAVLMRNSWEDKFFSMLMLEANDQSLNESNLSPTPIDGGAAAAVNNNNGQSSMMMSEEQQQHLNTMNQILSTTASTANTTGRLPSLPQQGIRKHDDGDDFSDVSSGDLE